MSALRKLVLSPAAKAAVLQRLPALVVAEIRQAEQTKAERAKKQAKEAARRKFEAVLRACFPLAFRGPPRPPLAIGIFDAILEVAGDEVDRYDLARFLKWWCAKPDYWDAIAHREIRVDLSGSPADVPTPEQQEHAARLLWGPRADAMLARIRARAGAAGA